MGFCKSSSVFKANERLVGSLNVGQRNPLGRTGQLRRAAKAPHAWIARRTRRRDGEFAPLLVAREIFVADPQIGKRWYEIIFETGGAGGTGGAGRRRPRRSLGHGNPSHTTTCTNDTYGFLPYTRPDLSDDF